MRKETNCRYWITGNVIATGAGSSTSFDHALRLGIYVNAGYEFVLDKKNKYGLSFGIKYHLTNILGTQNGQSKLSDKMGYPYSDFYRRIGFISVSVGINLYTGVEPIAIKRK